MAARAETGEFVLSGSGTACLLIHGFSGTPYEMRYLGERLNAAGHAVRGVRLPGHATHGPDLYEAAWRDWYAAALHGLEDLVRTHERVAVIGLSMGALLALRLAAERGDAVDRVAALAPALVLADKRLRRIAPAARWISPVLPRRWAARPKAASDIADEEARRAHPLFPISLRGFGELIALQKSVRPLLRRVTQPVLLLHGRLDRTCPLENLAILEKELGSRQVTSRVFERSGHILTVDAERDAVADEVLAFLSSPPPA